MLKAFWKNKKNGLWKPAAENSLLPDALAKPEINDCIMIIH